MNVTKAAQKTYALIVSDIDGTLMNSKKEISRENLQAIGELAKKGIIFVPSSGRSYSEIPESLKQHPDIRYVISSNGSVIFDKVTGESTFMCIPRETVRKLFELFGEFDCHITARQGGELHVDAGYQSDENHEYYCLCEGHHDVVRRFGVLEDAFDEYVKSLEQVEMFSVFFHLEEEWEMCRQRLGEFEDLLVAEPSYNNFEICSRKAGKGNSLLALCRLLGIDPEASVSVGDSDNDTTMIEAAGLGLAVENACESVKRAADRIICNNEEHIVPYILEHFFDKGV